MPYSNIEDRKKVILEFIIDEYLKSSLPVGSRTVSKNSKLGVSAATIRNEMSDLEELGLLEKAHTSSGRIPSKLAYKYYVDNILGLFNKQKSNVESTSLTVRNENPSIKGESALNLACDILSETTKSVIVSSLERFYQPRIKKIEVLNISKDTYVIVSILDNLEVSSKVFTLKFDINESELKKMNFLINRILDLGYSYKKDLIELQELNGLEINKDMIQSFLYLIKSEYDRLSKIKTKITGLTNILDMPEYENLEDIKSFLNFVDNRENIKRILDRELSSHINAFIGEEIGFKELKDNSLIVTELILDNSYKIKIGVLSPLRSDYKKIISSLYNISWKLVGL